eukprot:s1589_g8.t1
MWLSCDCGPYSPLQRLNRNNPNQIQALEEKQAYARAEYAGAIQVAKYAQKWGPFIHWELSGKCEAWNLPMIHDFDQQTHLQKVTCHGCTVNLRASDTGELMCKGWTIATSHAGVFKHMHVPCQKNHKKVPCESGRPKMSAFYTPVFAKKVKEAMQFHEPWSLIADELQKLPADIHVPDHSEIDIGSPSLSLVAADDLSSAERDRINKLLKHIHNVSGHGSIETMVRALQKRGVQDHVIELARRFECPICQERKRVAPRRPASLETIPLKWQAHWQIGTVENAIKGEQGRLRPGSCVGLHRASRLLKAAPEHLRAASERELAVESLKGPIEIPWTITSLATHPTRKTYIDISQDIPTAKHFEEACNHPTGGVRYQTKRKGILDEAAAPSGARSRTADMDLALQAETTAVDIQLAPSAEMVTGVEIAIDLPTSKRGIQKFIANPEAYVASQLRRQTVEVSERKLSPSEVEQFSDELEEDMWVVPTKENCQALDVPEGTVTKLQRAAYGLVEAPLWWYKSVSPFLASIGYVRMKAEPCIWVYYDEQHRPRSIISGHVDDLLFGGAPGDEVHLKLMAAIQAKFSWGSWEPTPFVQCGVKITQNDDFGFELGQREFVENLRPIHVRRDRERQRTSETTEAEKIQLRAVLGCLSWVCGQTDFVHSSDVGFSISTVPHSTVQDLLRANQLIHEVQRSPVKLTIHGMAKGTPLDMVAWAESAWANRPDNSSSTGGLALAAAPKELRQGKHSDISLLSWRPYKIDRASRSPACAETHAVVDGEDELFHLRFLWSERQLAPQKRETWDSDTMVRHAPGILVTGSRNFYDKLLKNTPVIKGAERRADIEALTIKESMSATGLMLRWVHSDAQMANSHTKPSENHQILMFQCLQSKWRIIYDPDMLSARRRKSAGMEPMDNPYSY